MCMYMYHTHTCTQHLDIIWDCLLYFLPQYQVASAEQSPAEKEPKQNGGNRTAHSVKTTTIHIKSKPNHVSPPDTVPPNTNNNNSSIADEARKRGLPTSVVNFLSNMPEPVRAPADSEIVHTEQEAADWEHRKAWRDQKEDELKQEVSKVQDMLSKVTADVQAKPLSDTTK